MPGLIYGLCAATALLCAVLLLRAFGRSGYRLLLWAGLCFLGLSANNFLVIVDELVLPAVDMLWIRSATALVSMLLLLYGLIWESD